MKMKHKKLISYVTTLGISVSLLAGCGIDKTETEPVSKKPLDNDYIHQKLNPSAAKRSVKESDVEDEELEIDNNIYPVIIPPIYGTYSSSNFTSGASGAKSGTSSDSTNSNIGSASSKSAIINGSTGIGNVRAGSVGVSA